MSGNPLSWHTEPVTEGQKKLILSIQEKYGAPEFEGNTKAEANAYIRKYNQTHDGAEVWRNSYVAMHRENNYRSSKRRY